MLTEIRTVHFADSSFCCFTYISPETFVNAFHYQYVCHRVKSVCIQSYSGPYFPVLGQNTERYSVCLRI